MAPPHVLKRAVCFCMFQECMKCIPAMHKCQHRVRERWLMGSEEKRGRLGLSCLQLTDNKQCLSSMKRQLLLPLSSYVIYHMNRKRVRKAVCFHSWAALCWDWDEVPVSALARYRPLHGRREEKAKSSLQQQLLAPALYDRSDNAITPVSKKWHEWLHR